jgi:hypothetical protein
MDDEIRAYIQATINELREINVSLKRLIDFMIDKKPETVREILDREGLV